jgi:isocitrate lyase
LHGTEPKLWRLLAEEGLRRCARRPHRRPGGADGEAGLRAIYLSGWQVAADGNLAADVYPDQSLYPANSVPAMVSG